MKYAFALLLLPLLSVGDTPGDVQLIRAGLSHGDQVDAESSDGWWGLFPTEGGYELRSVAIVVTRAFDAVLDNEGEETGKKITVAGAQQPLFLVKGVEGLTAGPVTTAFDGMNGYKVIYPGERFNISLSADEWQMSLSAFGTVPDEQPQNVFATKYVIYANGKGKKQEIYRSEAVDDGVPGLIWAGDLDRDGQPDLLMDLTMHYNMSKWTLFLSSKAEPREVVGKVVEWITTGC